MRLAPRFWFRLVILLAAISLGRAPAFAFPPAPAAAPSSTDAATRSYAVAVQLQNRDQFELAADEWQKFLTTYASDPRVARARHYLGLCQLKLEKYAEAAKTFQQLIDDQAKLPAGALVAEAADGGKLDLLPATYYYLGLAQFNLGSAGNKPLLDKAQQNFATLAEKFPRSPLLPQALYNQGEAAYAAGRKADAVGFYAQLAKQLPDDPLVPDALYAEGVAESELNKYAEAEQTFARYLKQYPQHRLAGEVTLRRGEALLQLRRPQDAAQLFAEAAAIADFPLADFALRRQADALYEQQKYAEAAGLYQQLARKFPKSQHAAPALLTAGRSLYLANQLPQAVTILEPLSAADNDAGREATHWLARCLLKQDQADAAITRVDAKLKTAGNSTWTPRLLLDRADALFDDPKRARDAADAYQKLADSFPENELAGEALYMSAFCALKQGDYPRAAATAQKFIKQYPKHELFPAVRYVSAESRLLEHDYRDAEKQYGSLLKDFPKHADANNWALRRALALSLSEQPKEVVGLVKSLAGKLPSAEANAQAYYLLGNSYYQQSDWKQAVEALQASLKAAPKGPQADEVLLLLAQATRQRGDNKQAREILNQGVEQFSDRPLADKIYFRAAEYAYSAGDYEAAIWYEERLLKNMPNSSLAPQTRYGLGWAQFSLGQATAAAATFDQLLADKPPADLVPRARYARGVARQALKQYAPAIDDFQAFLDTKPKGTELSDARYNLGLCLVATGKQAAAIDVFRKLLADDAKYSGADRVLNELAWANRAVDRSQDAAAAFEQLVKQFPKSPLIPEAQSQLADSYYEKEDFSRAADLYASAAAACRTPLAESIWHRLGWSRYRLAEYDSARTAFETQLTQFPKGELSGDAQFMVGETYFKQDQFAKALDCYAAVSKPKAAGVAVLTRLHGGQAAGQIKQWKSAVEWLDAALEADPQGPYAPEVLYELASAKKELGQADDALKLYETVTERTGDEIAARARFMIGEIRFERKEHQQAIKDFFRVMTYDAPRWQAAAGYESGRCFEVLKQPDQARRSYQEVVEKYPKSDQAPLARQRLEAIGPGNKK